MVKYKVINLGINHTYRMGTVLWKTVILNTIMDNISYMSTQQNTVVKWTKKILV